MVLIGLALVYGLLFFGGIALVALVEVLFKGGK